MKSHNFFSKILLFGEYSAIKNGMALTIPFNKYKGHLEFADNNNFSQPKKSNDSLKSFFKYLENIFKDDKILDLNILKTDIEKGLYFKSNIPMGYGIGSSGALVAAIYNKYAIKKISKTNILKLKSVLAKMENFFHSKSSGIDPLICYLKSPILVNSRNNIEKVNIYDNKSYGNKVIFLINSNISRKSVTMVDTFFKIMKKDKLYKSFVKFLSFNNNCINSFLNKDISSLFLNVEKLSNLFFNKFSHMIPSNMHNIWKTGLRSKLYYLKLCGAGGGGYIIGFTENIEKTKQLLFDYKIIPIYKF